MAVIEIKTQINSDIKTCFDLARNIDSLKDSLKRMQEIPFAGKTTGLIGFGEWVSWEGKHMGIVQHLTAKITEFNAPYYFVDEMVFGVFKSFRHEHIFHEENNKTIMVDKFHFESPLGFLGKAANLLFLKRYMKKLIEKRSAFLKEKAEA